MPPNHLRTKDLAQALGVHVNSIRLYETLGYFSPIPRGANGYRLYSLVHLEQARLIQLVLQYPYVGSKATLIDLIKCAAQGDLGMAMELAYQYLATIRIERTSAEAAIEFLERWAAGYLIDAPQRPVTIREAAARLQVTSDMLRNWERNGLLSVPRDPSNGYRLYGTAEFGRIRVIRTLVQAGYSLMAILSMLMKFDAGQTENLRAALDLPPDEDQYIQLAADRWLASLIALEERGQAIIRQVGKLIELAHRPPPA